MMAEMDEIYELLPQIDCGSCGAPTCRTFAEDVVKGECHTDPSKGSETCTQPPKAPERE